MQQLVSMQHADAAVQPQCHGTAMRPALSTRIDTHVMTTAVLKVLIV